MITSRLKDNLCPGCRSILTFSLLEKMHSCSNSECHFKITEDAFNSIVSGLYKPRDRKRFVSEEENLSMLNNLGHSRMSEDYSDRMPSD